MITNETAVMGTNETPDLFDQAALPIHVAPPKPNQEKGEPRRRVLPLPSRILTSKDAGFVVRDDLGNAVSCAIGTPTGFDAHVVGVGKVKSFKTIAAAETRAWAARARRIAKRKEAING